MNRQRLSSVLGYEQLEDRQLLAGVFSLVADINPGTNSSMPDRASEIGDETYFSARTQTGASVFKMQDGAVIEAASLDHTGAVGATELAVVGLSGFFSAGNSLWEFDASTGSVQSVFDQYGVSLFNPSRLDSVGDALLFTAKDSANNSDRYLLNDEGISKITDLFPGADERNYDIWGSGTHGSVGYVAYYEPSSTQRKVGIFDGSSEVSLVDVNYPDGFDDPRNFSRIGDSVYFTARASGIGRELFVLAENEISLVEDFRQGSQSSSFSDFIVYDEQLYFAYNPSDSQYTAIMSVNDTGIQVVGDIAGGYFANSLLGFQDSLLFVAYTDATDGEPYQLDLSNGTVSALDEFVQGQGDGNVKFLFSTGEQAYLRSWGPEPHEFGNELWTFQPDVVDLQVSNVGFLDANEDTVVFDVSSAGYTGEVEVVLVRSDNLRFDVTDEQLATKTITISGDGTVSDSFQLSTDDQVIDANAPFYLVVVDPAEAGTAGDVAENIEENNIGKLLKDENYIFVDFGLGFEIQPGLANGTLSGTVDAFKDVARGLDFTNDSGGPLGSDTLTFPSLGKTLVDASFDFDGNGVSDRNDEIEFATAVKSLAEETYVAFNVRIVSTSLSSFEEVRIAQDLVSESSNPAYALITGYPLEGYLGPYGLYGASPSDWTNNGINLVPNTVLTFTDSILWKAQQLELTPMQAAQFVADTLSHEVAHSFGVPHIKQRNPIGQSVSTQSLMQTLNDKLDRGRPGFFAQYPMEVDSPNDKAIFGENISQFGLLAEELGLSRSIAVYGTGLPDRIHIQKLAGDRVLVKIIPVYFGVEYEPYEFEVELNNGQIFVYSGDGNDELFTYGFEELNSMQLVGGQGIDVLTVNATEFDDQVVFGLNNRTPWDPFSMEVAKIYLDDGNDELAVLGQYPAILTVYGQDGDDVIDLRGSLDAVTVYAGRGNDTVYGSIFSDFIFGAAGNDTIFGNRGNDRINGGAGDDQLYGDQGNDRIYAGSGNDYLNGGADDDHLDGGKGIDNLFGESGRDTLFGGLDFDDDQLWGGEGADCFIVAYFDVLRDFDSLEDKKGRGDRGGGR